MPDWIQVCPRCRAAAPDLVGAALDREGVVESDGYRALSTAVLEETLPFRHWALICERTGDRPQQAEALLQAAWAADDAAAMTEAARLRTEVAALWDGTPDVELGLRRLDVLRRAGLFDRRPHGPECWPDRSRGDRTADHRVPAGQDRHARYRAAPDQRRPAAALRTPRTCRTASARKPGSGRGCCGNSRRPAASDPEQAQDRTPSSTSPTRPKPGSAYGGKLLRTRRIK